MISDINQHNSASIDKLQHAAFSVWSQVSGCKCDCIHFKYHCRAGGEEDFDMFMECVKARSAAAQTRALNSQGMYWFQMICLYVNFCAF